MERPQPVGVRPELLAARRRPRRPRPGRQRRQQPLTGGVRVLPELDAQGLAVDDPARFL